MSANAEATLSIDEGNVSQTSHEIRITNHGKMHAWVEFSLDFFQKNPDRPLTLHTLPLAKAKSVNSADAASQDTDSPAPQEEPPAESLAASKKGPRMHTSMSTIPRLVSVVEIIKREYLKTLDPELAEAGKLSGLHQYNEVGELEGDDLGEAVETAEEDRQRELSLALQGKRHLRQHKMAFMKVTLCRKELPDLVLNGATYQKPQIRALSKSARARLKKKLKKAAANE